MSVRLILVGPPGAGKGTQAQRICDRYGIPAISTGEIFRAHAQAGDEFGKMIASYTERGELVPDEVTDRMVADRLSEPDTENGFLLDGYPRNLSQVEALDKMLAAKGTPLDVVLELTADDEVVVQRLLGRAQEQNRADDTESVIRYRVKLYHETTEPLVDVYNSRGLLVRVNGIGEIDEISDRIATALDNFLQAHKR